jgi:hypothetical protein
MTGRFGPVRIGSSKEEVIKALGKPDSDNDYGTDAGGLMYAWYEFFYWHDSLKIHGIQNDHLTTWGGSKRKKLKDHQESICFKNDRISIDIWFLKLGQDITYGEVINILRKEQIIFEEIYDQYQGHLIKFKSGVTMDFDDLSGVWLGDNNGNFKKNKNVITAREKQLLNGIRLFDHT